MEPEDLSKLDTLTMVKHCRPLFGLVKLHVHSRFQVEANNIEAASDLIEDPKFSDSASLDQFSSLPANGKNLP